MLERAKAQRLFRDAAEGDSSSLVYLFDLLCEVQGWDGKQYMDDMFQNGLWLADYLEDSDEGKWGMSTADAIRCLMDFSRTQKFIASILRAGENLPESADPHRAVEAGIGTGVLSVALALAGFDEVVALEINPITAQLAGNFINECGVNSQVHVVQADATQLPLVREKRFDAMVSENLHTALIREPQSQIMRALLPLLNESAQVIPASIILSAALAHCNNWPDGFRDTDRESLDEVTQLTAFAEYDRYGFKPGTFKHRSVEGKVRIHSSRKNMVANTLLLAMAVELDEEDTLAPDEGKFLGATHAIKLRSSVPVNEDMSVYLRYEPGCQPSDMIIRVR